MGLFNHNSHVSADTLVHEVNLHPADEALIVGGGQYVPRHDSNTEYIVQRAFFMDKGIHGTEHHVRGEHPGVVSMRKEPSDNAYSVHTRVTVPIKAQRPLTTTYIDIEYNHEQVALKADNVDRTVFYKQLIANAVLVAANGTGEQQSNQ